MFPKVKVAESKSEQGQATIKTAVTTGQILEESLKYQNAAAQKATAKSAPVK